MTVTETPPAAGPSASAEPGGDSSSSDGSSSIATGGAAKPYAERVKEARQKKGLTRYKVDQVIGNGLTKRIEEGNFSIRGDKRQMLNDLLGLTDTDDEWMDDRLGVDQIVSRGTSEKRPSADGKAKRRSILSRKPRAESGGSAASQTRPTVRRVSTSPLTEFLIGAAAGGLGRMGQGPLGAVAAFTAPVGGEIVDDAIAGTTIDKIVQPFVRGSDKYRNLGAYFTCLASVAWATNVPESSEQAYDMFRWSMMTLLPLQGKEMARRAREQRKAMEAMAEIEPELVEMFGPDPIRGLWTTIWARQPEPAPADEPVSA